MKTLTTHSSRQKVQLRAGVILALIVGFGIFFRFFDLFTVMSNFLNWINTLGWIGIVIFILVYIAACIFLIPGSVLTLGAGFIFGVTLTSIAASIASTLGATAAFIISRYFARERVLKKFEGKPFFHEIDMSVASKGWKMLFLLRLSPVVPFNILNYAMGLTSLKLKEYVLVSWIGMLPGTIMYSYIGSLASSLMTINSTIRQKTTPEWIIYGTGLLATVVVTIMITRTARNALSKIV